MKKTTLTSAKKKAWIQCSIYVRTRDALATTGTLDYVYCISCGKRYPAFGKGCVQAGHFVPGRGGAVLFDVRGIHAQCYNCNVNLKGNWVPYEKKLRELYGADVVEELKALKYQTKKWTIEELEELTEEYKQKTQELYSPAEKRQPNREG